MAYKQSKHIFQGMNKDLSEDKQKGIYYIDAHNIRITAREDTTLLSVTNEKGNIKTIDKSFGQYIGHAVLNKYLVLFTIANGNSCITRIEITAGNYIVKVLYSGNLGFSADYPIETLVDYETEEVQKVYWTDGWNQPRVINIVGNIKENNDNQFDFVPEVYSGGNNIDVKIEKLFSTEGVFKAGTIQYFITYYNKFGQESNVIWQSPLLYISSKDRGNSPAETVTNSFKLTINISNISFDSIRIYSVQHTSENTDLIGKRIIDLNVSNESTISYVDNGTSGESIDPAELYYKGGIPTAIGTMSAKDQVLFLGNITLKDRSNVSQSIKDAFKNGDIKYELSASFKAEDAENKLYDYYNQLNEVGQTEIVNINGVDISLTHSIKSFKYLETYRFGIQFQDKWGKWSEPVFIKDVQNIYPPTIKNVTIQSTPITQRSDYVFLATAKLNIASFKQSLIDAGYIKARPLVVLPKENERECIAQGVLCPTVYNVGDRKTNSPYAQPSWFFRPYGDTGAISNISKELATFLPSVHNSVIQGKKSIYSEIEKAPEKQVPPNTIARYNDNPLSDDVFFIDQSIATLNSPDIEFTELNSDLSDCGFRIIGAIDVTGFAGSNYIQTSTPPNNFYTPKGTAFPTEGRPTMGEVAEGFIPKYVQQTNLYLNSDTKGWGIMGSGGFWYDTPYTTWIDHAEGHASYVLPSKYRYAFMVYPWQATGSLNNTSNKDVINSRGITDRINTDTAKLEYKTIANLRYSTNTIYKIDSSLYSQNLYPYYGEGGEQLIYQTSDIQVLDPKVSDTINVRSSNGSFVYYSNIDKLLSVPLDNSEEVAGYAINSRGYNKNYDWDIFYTDFDDPAYPYDGLISDRRNVRALRKKEKNGREAFSYLINDGESSELHTVVRATNTLLSTKVTSTSITYRSNKHAVISLSDDGNNQTILPSITIYKEDSEQEIRNKTIGNIPIQNPITENYDYNVDSYDQSAKKYTLHEDYFWTQHYSGIKQYSFSMNVPKTFYDRGYLLIGEIYRKTVENRFGGDTDDALQQNVWIPAGESIDLTDEHTSVIRWTEGDTYFQRYDCLKTYPYSNESLNNIVEILSFNCESRINIAGRYDRNRGLENNTYINNDNFNLLNKVYNQKDNFFSYNILDDRFDINTFKTQLTWSKVKTAGDLIDNWTNITLTNTLDLDGDKGELVSLNRFKNDIIAFQPKGISQIKFNSNIQIQTTQGMPVELANSGKVDGKQYLYEGVGCQNKWSICDEPHDSLYFIDNYAKSIYKLSNQGLVSITDIKGFRAWMENNNSVNSWKPYRNNSIESTASRNASNTIDTKNPAPFRTFYDKTFRDIYFVNRDTCLIYSDLLDEFISSADYQSTNAMFNIEDGFYAFYKNECLYKQFAGDYSNIYGELKDYWITFIDNQIPEVNKIYTNIEYRNDVYNNDELQSSETFSTVRVFNEYQDTTDVPIKTVLDRPVLSNLQKKFRVWRIQIPRDGNNIVGDRINNTWAKITLKKHPKDSNQKTVLHDAVVGCYY